MKGFLIIRTAENMPLPETYREMVSSLPLVAGFDKKVWKIFPDG